jgi:[ribosomal protein S5]-alanine N-acetyltransferase
VYLPYFNIPSLLYNVDVSFFKTVGDAENFINHSFIVFCQKYRKINSFFGKSMSIFLETERLIIKAPSAADLDDQYQLQSDPDVMQYIATGARTRAEVEKSLQLFINHYQKHSFSLGSVFEKATRQFIGRAGLIYLALNDTQSDIEIGYALLKPYWGKGYATELTKALIEWAFSNLSVDKLMGVTRPENKNSRRVLEKAGMHFVKMAHYNGIEVTYYEIVKNEVWHC